MPKWVKTILAVLLLPFCYGASLATGRLLSCTGRAETIWVAMVSGAACWLVVYLLLPKPLRIYVLGHELTHVLWIWLFGGRVKRLKITARGGYVIATKSNFLIALSPYFFPLYVALVVLVFGVGHVIWNWSQHMVWLHFFVGAAYSFHLTLTWHILQIRQSDITGHGRFFSAVIIFLGNIVVLMIGLSLLMRLPLLTSFGWWLRETGNALFFVRDIF